MHYCQINEIQTFNLIIQIWIWYNGNKKYGIISVSKVLARPWIKFNSKNYNLFFFFIRLWASGRNTYSYHIVAQWYHLETVAKFSHLATKISSCFIFIHLLQFKLRISALISVSFTHNHLQRLHFHITICITKYCIKSSVFK